MKEFHETIGRCYKEPHEERALKKNERKLELSFLLSSAVAQAPWVRGNAESRWDPRGSDCLGTELA